MGGNYLRNVARKVVVVGRHWTGNIGTEFEMSLTEEHCKWEEVNKVP